MPDSKNSKKDHFKNVQPRYMDIHKKSVSLSKHQFGMGPEEKSVKRGLDKSKPGKYDNVAN